MTNEEYCKQLERRVAELEKENAELRAQLGISDTKTTAVEPLQDIFPAAVHKYSSPDEKIQLFRSLFRGREDVFAKRWYSAKTEKSGYSPSAPMNGAKVFVSNQKVVAQSAKTVSWWH